MHRAVCFSKFARPLVYKTKTTNTYQQNNFQSLIEGNFSYVFFLYYD